MKTLFPLCLITASSFLIVQCAETPAPSASKPQTSMESEDDDSDVPVSMVHRISENEYGAYMKDPIGAFENSAKGKELLAKANAGDTEAQMRLAYRYYKLEDLLLDLDVPSDVYKKHAPKVTMLAMDWWTKAANAGEVLAMVSLAHRYALGDFGAGMLDMCNGKELFHLSTTSKTKAEYWLGLAKRNLKPGDEDARTYIDDVLEELKTEEVMIHW